MSEQTTVLQETADALVAKAEAVREATKKAPPDVNELLDLTVQFADLLEKIRCLPSPAASGRLHYSERINATLRL